nr:hypothetical protein [candidate division Zixibacteria bacterium]
MKKFVRLDRMKLRSVFGLLAILILACPNVMAQANELPVLDPIGSQTIDENLNLSFSISASDVESTPVLTTSTLPTGASFTDNTDGTGTFSWTPDYTQSG